MFDNFRRGEIRDNAYFVLLLAFTVVVFAFGGSSRSDVLSLILLWPIAALVAIAGLWRVTPAEIGRFRLSFLLLALAALLVIVQLIPLPPEIWQALPGRGIAVQAARAAGVADSWMPLNLTPARGWTSLYALTVPLAAMILALRCSREQRGMLMVLLLGIGLASGLLGLVQSLGAPQGPLYPYRITSHGYAVGLFANRNHQAVFLACLFPMLAVYASTSIRSVEHGRFRKRIAGAAAAVLAPLILVTGSRAGTVLMIVALAATPFIYARPRISKPPKRTGARVNLATIGWAAGFALLGILTVLSSRAASIERLLAGDDVPARRLAVWPPIAEMAWKYFPVGSGVGSFVEIYQIDEPRSLLTKNYVNHAHNDWLEVLMTAGAVGAALAVAAFGLWLLASIRLFRAPIAGSRTVQLGRLGALVIGLLGLASLVDYPLRVPSLACLLVFAAMWVEEGVARQRDRARGGEAGAEERGGSPTAPAVAGPSRRVAVDD